MSEEHDADADGRERNAERLLEEQRQPYEDIKAELAEAIERGNSLEDQCSCLKDRLVQVLEEGEIEQR